jgi:hypothetical protein
MSQALWQQAPTIMQKYDSHQDRLRRKLGADGSKITKEHNRASLQLLKKPTCK